MTTPLVPGYDVTPGGLYAPVEMRAAEFGAVTNSQTPDPWLLDWISGGRITLSGVRVSPQGSMALAAYYACIRVIAEDCAKLPLPVLEERSGNRQPAPNHWLWPILQAEMNPDMTAITAREVMTHHAVGWGNAYGLILRDQSMSRREGNVTGIYPLHPARVIPERNETTGAMQYRISGHFLQEDPEDLPPVVPAVDMIHIKGLGPDGLVGYSVAQLAAESLGLSLAAQRFGASFFSNGAHLSGILEHPAQLSPAAKDYLRASWRELYSSPDAAGETAILEEGMKYTKLGIPPNEAQFIESRAFQTREICRWFRMQPHKIADLEDAHHTNIESQNIEHVVDTMMPWFKRWEQEINRKLLAGTSYYVKHDTRGLLRGDSTARAQYYKDMFMVGAYSPNDILALEDMNGYDGGDERFLQIQYAPVSSIVDGTARKAPVATRPVGASDTAAQYAPASTNGHHRPGDED